MPLPITITPTTPPTDEAGPGSANPLMNMDGTSGLPWPWPQTRSDLAGILVSEGEGGRHTRAAHERAPRRYEATFSVALDEDAWTRLVEAHESSRGGAGVVRWRHPIDDAPGSLATSPLYRMQATFDVERGPGGVMGTVTVIMESV